MNLTRQGGVFRRSPCSDIESVFDGLAAHLANLNPYASQRTIRLTDVAMVVDAGTSDGGGQSIAATPKLLLSWDGRLDNKDELITSANLGDDERKKDASVVARTYATLGDDAWPTLVGDYSFACWDSIRGTLQLVRDPFGTRPLYYYFDESVAVWCSELSYFVEFLGNKVTLDDEFIATYLMAVEAPHRTPYRGISCVRPGHATVISRDSFTEREFWDVGACRDVRLGNDSQYEGRFRELFAQSVKRRLPNNGTAVAELSGGLDSSSIVSMASALSKDPDGTEELVTVSYIYDGSATADERQFISAVEKLRGVEAHFIEDRDVAPVAGPLKAPRPSGLHLFRQTYETLRETMDSVDASVLLSGFGGDEITLNEETFCPDLVPLLRRGSPIAALRTARRWAKARNSTTIRLLWTSAVWPVLPSRLQSALGPGTLFPKSWMGPTLSAYSGLWRTHVERGTHHLRQPDRRRQRKALNRAASFTSQCYHREQGCGNVTYPFLDRTLIEFLLGIPADQKLRPTESRSIQRRALQGILPDTIRLRKNKQGADEPLLRALARNWQVFATIFDHAEVYERGYINRSAFLDDLKRARHGFCRFTAPLARVLSLELWLQSLSNDREEFELKAAGSGNSTESCVSEAAALTLGARFVETATERR